MKKILKKKIIRVIGRIKMTNDPMNLFDSQICVDCGLPCHFGSGRFVNRYSVYDDNVVGWRGGDCAAKVDAMLEEMNND